MTLILILAALGMGIDPLAMPAAATPGVAGVATWYDAPSPTDAAAGPALRARLGRHWRGSWVTVRHGDRSVRVRLTDWCACGKRHGTPTLLDLDDRAFARLAPLSAGVITVSVVGAGALPRLPPTDTVP